MKATTLADSASRTRREVWALGAALVLFVASRCLVPMDETDLFYNLRLGEIVLTTGTVPRTNLLSFTFPEHPDPNLAWVFQVVLALAYRVGGIPATVVLKTVFVVATFVLLYRVALRRNAHPALAAAALALAAWTAEPRFVERPHLVTFVGLATLLLAIERAEARRPALLWAMLPLGLVWANANSCFFLAPSLLLLYALAARVDTSLPVARRAATQAFTVGLALIPLLFATPSGSRWMGYVANHFRMPSLRPLQEYRLAEWPTDAPFLFLLLAVTTVTVIGARSPRSNLSSDTNGSESGSVSVSQSVARQGFLRRLLPVLALALLGSRRIRFVAEFALLAGPFVAARATDLLWSAFARRPRTTAGAAAGWAVAGGLVLLVLLSRVGAARPFDIGIEAGLVPSAAIEWIDARRLRDRMYNDLEVGSYLAWQGWPANRVFQDPRINGYPAELHAILRRSDLRRDEWEALLARFDVQSALITFPDVNPRAALFDPERWAVVYRAPDALVFVRRGLEHAALVDAEELPLGFRFDPTTGVDARPLAQPPSASMVRTCEWHRRLADWFIAAGDPARAAKELDAALVGGDDGCLAPPARDRAREQAATLALDAGDPARALRVLAGVSSPRARRDRGFALLQLSRPEEALQEFEGATAPPANDDPQSAFGRALALVRLRKDSAAALLLRDFLKRWPDHLAAPQARRLLNGHARSGEF